MAEGGEATEVLEFAARADGWDSNSYVLNREAQI